MPKTLPYEKIIIETENMCKVIEQEIETSKPQEKYKLEKEIHTLREKVKKALTRSKNQRIKSNLTKQEQIGRKMMYSDTERNECTCLPTRGE